MCVCVAERERERERANKRDRDQREQIRETETIWILDILSQKKKRFSGHNKISQYFHNK